MNTKSLKERAVVPRRNECQQFLYPDLTFISLLPLRSEPHSLLLSCMQTWPTSIQLRTSLIRFCWCLASQIRCTGTTRGASDDVVMCGVVQCSEFQSDTVHSRTVQSIPMQCCSLLSSIVHCWLHKRGAGESSAPRARV